MRKLTWLVFVLGVFFIAGCSHREPLTLRVLTYNIHHGEGMDGKIDLERIAAVIRQAEPDLVALQEVDRGVKRSDRVDQPARLAELTGMKAVFERNIEYQGGDYGNAVLSRLPIVRHRNHFLPQSVPDEQRGMLEVHVNAGGRPLMFLATHLSYHPSDAERMASVIMIRSFLEQEPDVPTVLAGDMNALPDSRVVVAMTEFLVDTYVADSEAAFTFPADKPDRRIDYILHNRGHGWRSVEYRVLPESIASDHRPVLAVLQLD